MRPYRQTLLGAALAIAIFVLATPSALAQCAPAQVFGSTGLAMLGMVQVEIAGGLSGTEIGRFWNAGNSNFANNFAEACPASNWLVLRNSGDRGVSGAISGTGCIASSCPGPTDEMIWLIEDFGPTGPPGVGDTAFFIGFRMDATPAAARYWDLARAAGNLPATLPFLQFPSFGITGQTGTHPNLTVTFDLADVGPNFHGANAGGAILDSVSIVAYDICTFFGPGEPGRPRSAGWSCTHSIPYTDGPAVQQSIELQCPDTVNDYYVAVGMTFSGGAGPNIPSELVGPAWIVECDPNAADPDSVPDLRYRPHVLPKPRGGGR